MKKKYSILIAAFLIIINLVKAQAPPEIIYYNFNNTGSLVPNYASSPPPGTSTGTITQTLVQGVSNGQCGFALSGTGTSGTTDYINTAWSTSLTGSWSIAFWTASITPSSTLWYIFGDINAGSFRCFTNGVAGANNWILRATGMTDMLITGGAVMAPMHNVFVYDAANSVGKCYLNGVLQNTVTQISTSTFIGSAFQVGGYNGTSNLSGLMDEFKVYSRALTPSEVLQIATGTPGSFTLNVTSCGPYTSPLTSSVYTTSGVYTETYTSCGGTSTNNINLTVNAAPTLTLNAAPTGSICSGITVSLTPTGNLTTYTWNGTGGPNTSSITVTPASTSVYTLSGGNGGSCITTKTIGVNVVTTPTLGLSISPGNTLCLGYPLNITVSGATTYSWSTGATSSTLAGSPPTNTVYSITGNNGTCSQTRTIGITVSPNPTISASPSATICNGSAITLTATGAATFAWSTSAVGPSITITPNTATSYIVYGLSGSCSDSKTINITVNPSPTVSVVSSTVIACKNSPVILTGSGATTYSWNTGSITNPTTVYPIVNSTYTLTGTSGNCSKNATISISTIAGPIVTISSPTALCTGSVLSLTASGAFSYTWNGNAANSGSTYTDMPATNTSYTLMGKSPSNNCTGTATISVVVNPNPTVTVSSNRPVMCKGETVTITATGAPMYSWSSSSTTTAILVVNPTSNKTYTVTGTDANNCISVSAITQTVNLCTGIALAASKEAVLKVYPNPGAGLFTIENNSSAEFIHLEVFTVTGQQIVNREIQNGTSTIDLSNYDAGIYYLKITDGAKTETIKLIKE